MADVGYVLIIFFVSTELKVREEHNFVSKINNTIDPIYESIKES